MEISELLIHTKKNNASDLHISSMHPPVMRIHGDMMPLKTEKLTPEDVKNLLFAVMTEGQRADYERDMEIDFAIQFGDDLRFRVNAFTTISGPAAVFRSIPTKILTLDDLGMPEILKKVSMVLPVQFKNCKSLILVSLNFIPQLISDSENFLNKNLNIKW